MGVNNLTTNNNSGPGPVPPMSNATKDTSGIEDLLIDYNERFKTADPAMFRDDVIDQTMSVLIGKMKPNPLLVGPAGVGKTRIVEEIARRIANKHSSIPSQLADKIVYELPLSNLIAGAGVVGALEERVAELVDFASDPDNKAIIFIDEIHQLQNDYDSIMKKVSQMIKPALARGDMKTVGSTTLQEARSFDTDPAFNRRFTRVIVDELTREQTVEILKGARDSYAMHYKNKITISDDVLEKCAVIADNNSRADSHRPDNALTLLDRTMADMVIAHQSAIAHAKANAATMPGVAQALQAVATIALTESKLRNVAVKLMTGQSQPHVYDADEVKTALGRLRGQQEVADHLVDALTRDQLAVFPRTRPTAWMLAGPSGVGKTELAKIVAEQVTGEPPIILNMNEYSNPHDESKIIGSGPGYVGSESNREMIFDALESNPYRVILLDEMEKAHVTIHRLFLTALDNGWMRMASGKIVDFTKTIIIATTNAAKDQIGKPSMGFSTAPANATMSRQDLTKALQQSFDAEFLGRFTEVLAFNKLDRSTYGEILTAAYERERTRILDEQPRQGAKIPATVDPAQLDAVVESTYLPDQGARPAEAAARRLIEDALLAAAAAGPALAGAGVAQSATGTPVDDTEGVDPQV